MGMPHHREVMVEAGAKPHDIGRICEEPGRPPLVMQRSDSAADEIRPDHLKGEPDLGKAKDPGGGDRELRIISVDVALVAPANRRRIADPAKVRRVLLFNPAPPAPPLFPPLLHGALRVCPLGPWDPGDTTGNGAPWLDPREEVVAEEHCVGLHPVKPTQRCAKRAMHATAFGVKSKRRKPKVCMMSLKKSEKGGQSPQEK